MAYTIVKVSGDNPLVMKIGRLLYEVYVEELKWEILPGNPVSMTTIDGILMDDRTYIATYFAAVDSRGDVIGCLRGSESIMHNLFYHAIKSARDNNLSTGGIARPIEAYDGNRVSVIPRRGCAPSDDRLNDLTKSRCLMIKDLYSQCQINHPGIYEPKDKEPEDETSKEPEDETSKEPKNKEPESEGPEEPEGEEDSKDKDSEDEESIHDSEGEDPKDPEDETSKEHGNEAPVNPDVPVSYDPGMKVLRIFAAKAGDPTMRGSDLSAFKDTTGNYVWNGWIGARSQKYYNDDQTPYLYQWRYTQGCMDKTEGNLDCVMNLLNHTAIDKGNKPLKYMVWNGADSQGWVMDPHAGDT
ncbi:hypothetical protein HDU86_007566 [Geranomyces michiganensis]|nr:hypothetical protein HDU86_007566 [Geranomyces michiganensis]